MNLLDSANFGLWIVLGILLGTALISLCVGWLMKRQGASRKPLYWFLGFMSLVLLPQLAGHLINAYMRTPRPTEPMPASATAPGKFSSAFDYSDPQKLFGARGAGAIVVDGRGVASGLLHSAENPKFFVLPTGETLLVGRFADSKQASDAIRRFLKEAQVLERARADGAGGFFAERGAGDLVHARADDSLFTVWSGPSVEAIQQLQIATGDSAAPPKSVRSNAVTTQTEWLDDFVRRIISSWQGLAVVLTILTAYLLLVAAYFFKGIAWATRVGPHPLTQVAFGATLRERLLAVNLLDVPFRVETGPSTNQLIVSWRYADAKWIDHARAHSMRRLHRIVLDLDEAQKKVRATDFATSYDWSAGAGSAMLNWKFVTGVVLFQYEHQRVFGLQLDEHGRFKPALSYAYTFNLAEMKAPLITAVTQAGWTWQPVAWQSPRWLKWLTE